MAPACRVLAVPTQAAQTPEAAEEHETESDSEDRVSGTVISWKAMEGYGWIKPLDGTDDVFCHATNIVDGNALSVGDQVEYGKAFHKYKKKWFADRVSGGVYDGSTASHGRKAYKGEVKVFVGSLSFQTDEDTLYYAFEDYRYVI